MAHKKLYFWIGLALVVVLILGAGGYLLYRHHSDTINDTASAGKSALVDYRSGAVDGTGVIVAQQTDTTLLKDAPAGFRTFIWQEVLRLRAVADNQQLADTDKAAYQNATVMVDQIDDDSFAVGYLSPTGRVLWAKVNDAWQQISTADSDGKFDCATIHQYTVPDSLTDGGQCVDSNLIQP